MQLVTVRAIGTFLSEPAEVPDLVVGSVAEQIGATDLGALASYGKLAVRWLHVSEIRDRYGYRDFADPTVRSRIERWLYRTVWSADIGPSALFAATHRKLLADRVVLPGEQILQRLINMRERATTRLWSRLVGLAPEETISSLEALLHVPDGQRRTGLDQLRRSPVSPTVDGLVRALGVDVETEPNASLGCICPGQGVEGSLALRPNEEIGRIAVQGFRLPPT